MTPHAIAVMDSWTHRLLDSSLHMPLQSWTQQWHRRWRGLLCRMRIDETQVNAQPLYSPFTLRPTCHFHYPPHAIAVMDSAVAQEVVQAAVQGAQREGLSEAAARGRGAQVLRQFLDAQNAQVGTEFHLRAISVS